MTNTSSGNPPENDADFKEQIKDFKDFSEEFVKSLKNSLLDILSLEVNTMVVTEISGFKFDPAKAYDDIAKIPKDETEFLAKLKDKNNPLNGLNPLLAESFKKIQDESDKIKNDKKKNEKEKDEQIKHCNELIDQQINRYVNLRNRLKSFCELILKEKLKKKGKVFPNNKFELLSIDELQGKDVPKDLREGIEDLWEDGRFLRQLRRLRELLYLIRGEQSASENIRDMIYAQTVIQIDGDVMNSFHKFLFKETDTTKEFLIKTHQDAVESGQKNWRELMSTTFNLINEIVKSITGNSK